MVTTSIGLDFFFHNVAEKHKLIEFRKEKLQSVRVSSIYCEAVLKLITGHFKRYLVSATCD